MIRISKLTDYGMVIMAFMATAPEKLFQAREIAQHTELALPTVSKLLKSLAKHHFLSSLRGVRGGYQLAKAPKDISVVGLIRALEGPIAITECSLGHNHCSTEHQCAIRTPWLKINNIITQALKNIKLSDLISSNPRVGEINDHKIRT